jgi:hypothetical protein
MRRKRGSIKKMEVLDEETRRMRRERLRLDRLKEEPGLRPPCHICVIVEARSPANPMSRGRCRHIRPRRRSASLPDKQARLRFCGRLEKMIRRLRNRK